MMSSAASIARRIFLVATALGVGFGAQSVPAAMAAEITWTFAHTTPIPGSTWNRYATEIVPERIRSATNGELKIEVVPGIVDAQGILPAIRSGRVQAGSVIFPYIGGTVPRWGVLGVPGLLKQESDFIKAVKEVVWPVVEREATKSWSATPVVIGAWTGASFFSNGPIDTIEKFAGTKYRTASPEQLQFVQAAGGAAVSMPFGELYTSLQRGLVDAYTGSVASVANGGLHEVTKYAESWPAGLSLWGFFVSQDALEQLPDGLRKKVIAEFALINQEAQAQALRDGVEGMARLKGHGMELISIPDSEIAKAAALAKEHVWPAWIKRAGPEGEEMLVRIQALDAKN